MVKLYKYSVFISVSFFLIGNAVFILNNCEYPKYNYPNCAVFNSVFLSFVSSTFVVWTCLNLRVRCLYRKEKNILLIPICFTLFQFMMKFSVCYLGWSNYFNFITSKSMSILLIGISVLLSVILFFKK